MGDAQLLQQLAELRVKLDKPILTIEGSSAPASAGSPTIGQITYARTIQWTRTTPLQCARI